MRKRGQGTFNIVVGGVIALVMIIVLLFIINNYVGGGAKKAVSIGESFQTCQSQGGQCIKKEDCTKDTALATDCKLGEICCKTSPS